MQCNVTASPSVLSSRKVRRLVTVALRGWGTMPPMLHSPPDTSHLFEPLVARARVDPPAGSLPLYLAERQCGWVAADVPALCQPVGSLRRQGDGWALAQEQTAGDAAWAALARHLHEAGRLRGWRNELLDVTALDGTVIGAIERAAVRPLGIATRAVHLNAWSPEGNMWISQRALDKSTDPGMWDTLVGGLVAAGETDHDALMRESWEEAGLESALLATAQPAGEYCVRRGLPEGYQIEWVGVFDVVLPAQVVPQNQDGEVAQIRQATPAEVIERLAAGEFTLEAALAIGLSFVRRGWLAAEVLAPIMQRPAN